MLNYSLKEYIQHLVIKLFSFKLKMTNMKLIKLFNSLRQIQTKRFFKLFSI
jgi:hypothetical protein